MDTFQEKKLEELLIKAANEPAHRPEFYSALLKSTIYVIGDTGKNSTAAGQQNLEAGSQINIQSWETQDGKPVIPFFSSLETLQKSIDNELSYLALPANSFFEMTLGSTLFLNPKSDYGKEFTSNEVEQLLKNGLSQAATQRVVEEETKVLLGQPENYPTQMIDSLTQLLAKHSNVKKAYLALMHDTSIDENPHLIVGIEAEGDIEKVISEVGNVAANSAPDGEVVDLFRVNLNESGLSQYFIESTQPFYVRKWGSKLRSLFGSGNL